MELSAPLFILRAQAKRLARAQNLKLHAAQNAIARAEGFKSWAHMAAATAEDPSRRIYRALPQAGLTLLAARPEQGKTLMGLRLAAEAARAGRRATFHSLHYTAAEVAQLLEALGLRDAPLRIDVSEGIDAASVSVGLDRGGFAVVDFLQLLDHRRTAPTLQTQVQRLKDDARAKEAAVVLISQISRDFVDAGRAMPDWADVRLPNPLDLGLFDAGCFLHDGGMRLRPAPGHTQ